MTTTEADEEPLHLADGRELSVRALTVGEEEAHAEAVRAVQQRLEAIIDGDRDAAAIRTGLAQILDDERQAVSVLTRAATDLDAEQWAALPVSDADMLRLTFLTRMLGSLGRRRVMIGALAHELTRQEESTDGTR